MAKRKPTTIDCDPFPSLSWRNGYWTCQDVIPGWAGFHSFETGDRSDGSITMTLPTNDKTRSSPTKSQVAAYKYVRRNATRIAAAIRKRIFREYAELQARYAEFVTPTEMPDILEPDDLNDLIGFSAVHFHRAAKDGVGYAGIHLDCTWDAEHALGFMVHKTRVVEFGGVETAILEWIAEADSKR